MTHSVPDLPSMITTKGNYFTKYFTGNRLGKNFLVECWDGGPRSVPVSTRRDEYKLAKRFEWGTGDHTKAEQQLAFVLLRESGISIDQAIASSFAFCCQVISSLPTSGWTISSWQILQWYEEQFKQLENRRSA